MSASLKGSALKLRKWLDALQPRERNIVLILALVVAAFLWDQLCYSPLQSNVAEGRAEMTSIADQIVARGNELRELTQPGKNPGRVLQDRKKQLQIAIEQLNGNIEQMTGNLIPAKKMVQVLEDVLRQSSSLQLLKVQSLPVRRLIRDGETQETLVGDDSLYLHAVELQLQGDYFETLSYLRALEELPWQVIWDQLEYQVDGYPQASVRLRINTLSASAGLLGV